MSVSREDVERIAELAEVRVAPAGLPALVAQLSRILDYVAQIAAVGAAETSAPFTPGPVAVRFRRDEVHPAPLAFGPDRFAPAFRDGLFLVPRLGAFEGGDRDDGEDGA